MRRAAKVDANQPEIVDAFRRAGCTVEHLHGVGKGCPDLAVSYGGVTHFVEVKDGALPPSARQLNADQVRWHAATRGTVHVVTVLAEALEVAALLKLQAAWIKHHEVTE